MKDEGKDDKQFFAISIDERLPLSPSEILSFVFFIVLISYTERKQKDIVHHKHHFDIIAGIIC